MEDESKHNSPYPTKWTLVNKKWFNLFQRLYYKSVSIQLDPTNKIIQDILCSPYFQPGLFVKNIHFLKLQQPAHFNENNIRQDLLYLLMEHCPNVKNIILTTKGGMMKESNWRYLSTVLLANTRWKLQSINLQDGYTRETELGDYSLLRENREFYYYQSVYHSRNTIQNMIFTEDMVEEGDYSLLKEFKNLTTLCILDDGRIGFVNDIPVLLEKLPQLLELSVGLEDGPIERLSQEEINSVVSYPKFKKLEFGDFIHPKKRI